MVWLRNLAPAGTWQSCGKDGFIHGMADGLVSARVVHDEGVARPWQDARWWLEVEGKAMARLQLSLDSLLAKIAQGTLVN